MLTNGMFGTLLTPESTVTRTAFAASACGAGDVLVTVGPDDPLFELLELAVVLAPPEPPPPPPPPHALTSNASHAALNRVRHQEISRMVRSIIE
jgi:hypothetical protein